MSAAVDNVSCPVCGSVEVTGGFVEVLDDTAWQTVDCDDCGSSWEDVFTLSGQENVRRGDRVDVALARRGWTDCNDDGGAVCNAAAGFPCSACAAARGVTA